MGSRALAGQKRRKIPFYLFPKRMILAWPEDQTVWVWECSLGVDTSNVNAIKCLRMRLIRIWKHSDRLAYGFEVKI